MKATRAVTALVVLGLAALMVAWWPGSEEAEPVEVPRPPGPAVVGEASGTGGTWFCAARDIGVEGFGHALLITSASDEPVTVSLTAFSDEPSKVLDPVDVPAGATVSVNVGDVAGSPAYSVMIESPDGPIAVEHRFTSSTGADQVACSPFSASEWYFPAVATTRDSKALLSIFNPFPADAAVDIEIALETGVRIPRDLSGVVVPSGTTRVVDIGAVVQRRDQFAATVVTRSGTVVAELGQSFDGSNTDFLTKGVRVMAGSRIAASRWSFAAGMVDPSTREKVVVLNPEEDAAEVVVQVLPYGGLEAIPEPFVLEVPGLRFSFVDLEAETRIPGASSHAIEVESSGGAPIVVARTESATADSPDSTALLRPGLTSGTTGSPGSATATPKWIASGLAEGDNRTSAVFIHNPSDGIAQAEISVAGSPDSAQQVEIPANDSIALGPEELGVTGTFSVLVDASTDVVVDRLIVFSDDSDFSLQPAIPRVSDLADLIISGD